jgi:hypothetical protein
MNVVGTPSEILLAMETSGDVCSVAVLRNGLFTAEHTFRHGMHLSERLMTHLEQVLQDADTTLEQVGRRDRSGFVYRDTDRCDDDEDAGIGSGKTACRHLWTGCNGICVYRTSGCHCNPNSALSCGSGLRLSISGGRLSPESACRASRISLGRTGGVIVGAPILLVPVLRACSVAL